MLICCYLLFTVSLVLVGFLWGATNPLIRRGSAGVDKVAADSAVKKFIYEILFLITRWQVQISNFYFILIKIK